MPTLAFVWWSRDAPVRSGWYETGLSIRGTEAREQPLRQFGQCFKLWTVQRGAGTGCASAGGISHCRLHCILSFPQATELSNTQSYGRIWSIHVFHWAVRSQRPCGKLQSCTVWHGPHIWHPATCIEQSNKTPECSLRRRFKIILVLLFLL